MTYVPEPTHPLRIREEEGIGGDKIGTDSNHTAQLQREFDNIFNEFLALRDVITRAVPWKGFNLTLNGVGGATGGAANTTLPTISNSYNIDKTFGTDGVTRTGVGVYVFRLLIAVIGGVEILPVLYPNLAFIVGGLLNLDPNAESVRDRLTGSDQLSGTIEITVEQLIVPQSGKGTWTPYDLRSTTGGAPGETGTDRQFGTATLTLGGDAADFGGSP